MLVVRYQRIGGDKGGLRGEMWYVCVGGGEVMSVLMRLCEVRGSSMKLSVRGLMPSKYIK
jgi:hypothetical protein